MTIEHRACLALTCVSRYPEYECKPLCAARKLLVQMAHKPLYLPVCDDPPTRNIYGNLLAQRGLASGHWPTEITASGRAILAAHATKGEMMMPQTDAYTAALDAWKKDGGIRPSKRPDGIPTRIDQQWMTPAELYIASAMEAVERVGASVAITDAVTLLAKARERVADHVEGVAALAAHAQRGGE